MDLREAKRRAEQHLAEQPSLHENYRYVLRDGRELADGWYFDYGIEPNPDRPPTKEERFAGAPGFLVEKETGLVRIVSWAEYQERELHGD